MARRQSRKRRRNPTPLQWGLIGAGALAVGGLSYYGWRTWKSHKAKKALQDLPVPPSRPLPPIPPNGLGGGPCGAAYPGFVPEGDGCVPTDDTPPGFYVAEGCSDFVFVEGEEGPQIEWLIGAIGRQSRRTKQMVTESADPTLVATRFLRRFWGECLWPPPPDASARIQHLFSALSYIVGREIVADGGRVLGTSDPDIVDEQIAERLAELGLPDFDPNIVPEIRLPDAEPDGPGPAVPPPPPKPFGAAQSPGP